MRCGAWEHAAAPSRPSLPSRFSLALWRSAFVISPRAPYKNAENDDRAGVIMQVLNRTWLAALVLVLASSEAAAQSTVYVDDNSACPGAGTLANPYCRIQDAICAIKDTGGGTVLVKPGTYNEALRMFFGVSVVSTDGPQVTTINPTSPALRPCPSPACGVSTTVPCTAVYFPSAA